MYFSLKGEGWSGLKEGGGGGLNKFLLLKRGGLLEEGLGLIERDGLVEDLQYVRLGWRLHTARHPFLC